MQAEGPEWPSPSARKTRRNALGRAWRYEPIGSLVACFLF